MEAVFGPQVCGTLAEAALREWLVADGLGGYAMGTVAGLRTRRYHGLLVVAGATPGQRSMGLAALEPVLVIWPRGPTSCSPFRCRTRRSRTRPWSRPAARTC
jgi:hypothetical protein